MHAARLISFYIFRFLLLKGAEVIKLSKAGECVCVCLSCWFLLVSSCYCCILAVCSYNNFSIMFCTKIFISWYSLLTQIIITHCIISCYQWNITSSMFYLRKWKKCTCSQN